MAKKKRPTRNEGDTKSCPVDGGDVSCAHEHVPTEPGKGTGHDHGHPHPHPHESAHHQHKVKERKILAIAVAITGITMVVEFIGGWLSNSLALVSDAGHMLTHMLALILSYAAIWIASRDSGPEYSFGLYRSETLSALFNSFILIVISALILYEAYRKFLEPGPIRVLEMLVIAIIGLVVNLITAVVLMRANPESDLNIKSAFLHMVSDTLSSVGVVIGAVVIYYTGWVWMDPALSVLITAMILIWVYRLTRSSIRVLLERVPEGLDAANVEKVIREKVPEVQGVHDIHIWEITTNMYNMTAHVVLENQSLHEALPVLKKVRKVVKEDFNIGHAALQLECTCVEE